MTPQPRPVSVRLSPGQARRVAQAATTGTIATCAEVGARVAAASMPASPRDRDASPSVGTDARRLASAADPGHGAGPAEIWHPGGDQPTGVSDLAVRLQAFELGDLFRHRDLAALGEMTSAQLRAQVTARERLHRHAQRVLDLAEADRAGDPRERAAAAGVVDLLGLLCEHAQGEQPPSARVGPRPRRPLTAPAHLWADTATPATPRAADDPAPEAGGPMVCGRCGLPLERSDLAAALGRPASQGWRHVDGRKTHFPQPVPERAARRAPHTPDSAAA